MKNLQDECDVWRLRAAVARIHHERLLMTLRGAQLQSPKSWTAHVYRNAQAAWDNVKWKEPNGMENDGAEKVQA